MYIERSKLKANSDLRAAARAQLKGNWGTAVLALLVMILIVGASACTGIGPIIIGGPFALGLYIFYIKMARNESPKIENIFDGFKRFGSSLALYIVIAIFTYLWMLLFIIPGIIAALRYSLAYFVLNDNPEMGAMEALRKSKELMQGQKGKLFLLYLSFIGWWFLSMFTLFIGLLWLAPYMQVSLANFYEDVKNAHEQAPQAAATAAV